MNDLTLPAGTCLLHVGPYQTGAGMLQQALHRRRSQLRGHGVVYPGTTKRPMRAGLAVLGRQPLGRRPVDIAEWQALANEVAAAHDARVCVSTEDFGSATTRQIRRIVADLGGDRVHVVAVARRLDALLPAYWLQRVQSCRIRPYESWLRGVLGNDVDDVDYKAFWSSQDIPAMCSRWEPVVGADRFHLIVTADNDLARLSDVFESLLGLPAGMLQATDSGGSELSANGAELLRRLNAVFLQHQWPRELYFRLVQQGMVPELRKNEQPGLGQPVPPPPTWAAKRISERSDEFIDQLRSLGVHVIGDVDRLRTAPTDHGATDGEWPRSISIDAAVHALQGTIRAAHARESGRHKRDRKQPGEPAVSTARPASSHGVPVSGSPAPPADLGSVPVSDLMAELRRRAGSSLLSWRRGSDTES